MTEAGLYLQTLIKAQGINQSRLVEDLGTDYSTLHRNLRGEQEPKGMLFVRLIYAVRGDFEHVVTLLGDSATEDLARQLAAERLARIKTAEGRLAAMLAQRPDVVWASVRALRDTADELERQLAPTPPLNNDA